jgi:mono/diheme cytochrome c family protein
MTIRKPNEHSIAAALFLCAIASCIAALHSAAAAPTRLSNQVSGDTDDRGVWLSIAAAPASARARKNPYAGQRNAVLAGEKLFRQHCAECHGDNAQGLRNASDLRAPGVQNATDGELVWFLRNGRLPKGMPPWSGLPEQRRWQIVTYLRTLR